MGGFMVKRVRFGVLKLNMTALFTINKETHYILSMYDKKGLIVIVGRKLSDN